MVYLTYWTLFAIPYFLTYSTAFVQGTDALRVTQAVAYWIVLFHTPCKGFADLVVFVITNDLSPAALAPLGGPPGTALSGSGGGGGGGMGEGGGGGEESNTAQGNKALRDEILYFVTSGIRKSAETSAAAAVLDPRRKGTGEWGQVANVPERHIDIEPLNALGELDGGVRFEDFYRVILEMLSPPGSDRGHGNEGGGGGGRGSNLSKKFDEAGEGDGGGCGDDDSGGGGGPRLRASFSSHRRPLFESENEERLAAELKMAAEMLSASVHGKGDSRRGSGRSSHGHPAPASLGGLTAPAAMATAAAGGGGSYPLGRSNTIRLNSGAVQQQPQPQPQPPQSDAAINGGGGGGGGGDDDSDASYSGDAVGQLFKALDGRRDSEQVALMMGSNASDQSSRSSAQSRPSVLAGGGGGGYSSSGGGNSVPLSSLTSPSRGGSAMRISEAVDKRLSGSSHSAMPSMPPSSTHNSTASIPSLRIGTPSGGAGNGEDMRDNTGDAVDSAGPSGHGPSGYDSGPGFTLTAAGLNSGNQAVVGSQAAAAAVALPALLSTPAPTPALTPEPRKPASVSCGASQGARSTSAPASTVASSNTRRRSSTDSQAQARAAERTVSFRDILPGVFFRIRKHFGITTEEYTKEWMSAAKVKLNEGGASQAFFFFSGNERFIVKSCTKSEMDTLKRIAGKYESYLIDEKKSLLMRILGAHCLETYSNRFYFFVMENLFKIDDDEEEDLHEGGHEDDDSNDSEILATDESAARKGSAGKAGGGGGSSGEGSEFLLRLSQTDREGGRVTSSSSSGSLPASAQRAGKVVPPTLIKDSGGTTGGNGGGSGAAQAILGAGSALPAATAGDPAFAAAATAAPSATASAPLAAALPSAAGELESSMRDSNETSDEALGALAASSAGDTLRGVSKLERLTGYSEAQMEAYVGPRAARCFMHATTMLLRMLVPFQ